MTEKKNNSTLLHSIAFGLIFLMFFLITYYSVYNFEIEMWLNYLGIEFRFVILPALIFFFSGFFIYKIFDSWRNKNVKKIYLLTFFVIIVWILLVLFGDYAWHGCSLFVKCQSFEGVTRCPRLPKECSIFNTLRAVLGVLSPILALTSLIILITQRTKKK